MAKFSLNIYGESDEIIKTYETDKIRFGVLIKALEVSDKKHDISNAEFLKEATSIVKSIFVGLTDAELMQAEMSDVLSTFGQIIAMSSKINGGSSKN